MKRARGKKSERGQSALLGVVALLVLAIGMYTTYNLSHAVYEKIELQNAADATAYSLATMEARTFNYLAFSNRAQIANYVQMMEWQSLFSTVLYVEGLAGTLSDLFLGAGNLVKVYPPVAEPLIAVGNGIKAIYNTVNKAREVLEHYVPTYIKLKTSHNTALFATGVMMVMATTTQLGAGATDIIAANDPDASDVAALRALNVTSFMNAFDSAAWVPQARSEEAAEARRLMTELIHGTRYSTGVFGPDLIAVRQPTELLQGLFGMVALPEADDVPRLVRGVLRGLEQGIGLLMDPGFRGTTKLVEAPRAEGTQGRDWHLEVLEATAKADFGESDLPAATMLVAKDKPTFARNAYAAVLSGVGRGQGRYCYYRLPDGHGGAHRPFVLVGQLLSGRTDFVCEDDSRFEWQSFLGSGGIQPYFKLASRLGITVSQGGFNQPDVWVWLTKSPEDMQLADGRDLRITAKDAKNTARLDARIGEDGVFGAEIGKGMHAVARAQVYYHRPGAWQEPPNLFNPFWGARLARKGELTDRLLNVLGPVGSDLSDSMWMH